MTEHTNRSRRAILCATGGLVALTAGCLADNGEQSPAADRTAGEGPTYEAKSFHHTDVPVDPDAVVHTTEDAAEDWVEDRDADDEFVEFVTETDFETAVVVSLEADGPTLCHELTLDTVAVETDSIVIDAQVSNEEDDEMGCAQQETGVGAVVRAVGVEPESVAVEATIVDRDGTEHEFER